MEMTAHAHPERETQDDTQHENTTQARRKKQPPTEHKRNTIQNTRSE